MSKQSTSKIFTEIYDKKIWGQGSGTGSRMSRNNKKYIEMVPLKRFGLPLDVAHPVLFLASAEASYITGANLEVTGGL